MNPNGVISRIMPAVAALAVAAGMGASISHGENSYFYAVDIPPLPEHPRLYRIQVDDAYQVESATEIEGHPWPFIHGVVWDYEGERLFGFDGISNLWFQIDVEQGFAWGVGPGEFHTIFRGMTYNSDDGKAYGATYDDGYIAVDPSRGVGLHVALYAPSETVLHGLVFIEDVPNVPDDPAPQTHSGLVTISENSNGRKVLMYIERHLLHEGWGSASLTEYNDSLLPLAHFGSDTTLMWNPASRMLLGYVGSQDDLYTIDLVSGNATLVAHWDLPFDIDGITIVPVEGSCQYVDSDNDGDIDLLDFSAFQLCFNGSQ